VNCANGDLLASTETQANEKGRVLDALGHAASEMRRKLGESLSTVEKYNTPLEQATTPSLEALQAYNLGFRMLGGGDSPGALLLFQRAAELDRNFAMAYWAASLAYSNLGETVLAVQNEHRAFELRERLSQLERLMLECDYYGNVSDLMKARSSCQLGAQTFPREPFFRLDLGVYSNILGDYESGLRHYVIAHQLEPQSAFYYRNIILTYLLLNRVKEAVGVANEARTKGLDSNFAIPILYEIAFYRDDAPEMARQAARAVGKPGVEDLLFAQQADTAAYYGRLEEARRFSRQASGLAECGGEQEPAAVYDALSAFREALFGNVAKAVQQPTINKKQSSGRDVSYALALTFAYAGDMNRLQAMADELAKTYPEDTVVRFNYLPTLRAKLALLHSNPQKAIIDLEPAAPYELGLPAAGFYNWPNLYPVYVRGEAYLAAHKGTEAAAEFQKILDHRGIVLNEPIGALAHLQLGRAYAMQGDVGKARAAYQDFLTLWKDADQEIPVLKQSKSEYSGLQ
jgi:tetratricopeptide (TPR) repeat protein